MNPDPLQQLQPLRLPEAVSWWPPAPGWWLLALALIVLLGGAAALLLRWRRRNRYRRAARRELSAAYRRNLEGNATASQFAADATRILKRAALARYPREEIAPLCNERWLAFLDASAGLGLFCDGPGQALAHAPYDPEMEADARALHDACQQWLRRHR